MPAIEKLNQKRHTTRHFWIVNQYLLRRIPLLHCIDWTSQGYQQLSLWIHAIYGQTMTWHVAAVNLQLRWLPLFFPKRIETIRIDQVSPYLNKNQRQNLEIASIAVSRHCRHQKNCDWQWIIVRVVFRDISLRCIRKSIDRLELIGKRVLWPIRFFVETNLI